MENSFNDVFVSVIKEKMPDNKKLVSFLIDLLSVGKESVYRRLRSEIPFTADEVVKVSISMGLSIDNIASIKNANRALYTLNVYDRDSSFDSSQGELKDLIADVREISKVKSSVKRLATNRLTYTFMMFSPQTLRFSYYKWFHQTEGIHPSTRYSDFSIPPEHRKVLEEFMSVYKDISLYIMVIDSNVFRSFILDLEYFHKRSLITVSEMEKIRIELYEMLDYLETIAANGVTDWGCKLELYLSPIVIDSIYSHFEYEGSERSQIWLYYCVDSLTTTNLSACSLQKDWIDSLKRYSTLISKSGEMQRIEYFNHQRQLIKDMGKR